MIKKGILVLVGCSFFISFAQPCLKIGHRGARGLEPENTMRGFKRALELGADAVEFDVQRCQTGELVVIHRDRSAEILNGAAVCQKTLAALQQLDVGMGERIPTLEQVLTFIDRRVKVVIDLKAPHIEQAVVQLISRFIKENGWKKDHIIVTSTSLDQIKEFKKFAPDIITGVLYSPQQELILEEIIPFVDIIVMFQDEVAKDLIDSIHALGRAIFVGIPDKRDELDVLVSMGVDGIFSNRPDIFAAASL